MTAGELIKTLVAHRNSAQAKTAEWFFKTAPGQYGHGDVFLGLKVPLVRKLIKPFCALTLSELEDVLASPYHEARLAALLILVHQYTHAPTARERESIYRWYLTHTARINNWDLVDSSAAYIVGAHLHGKQKTALQRLARSHDLWERRIAIVATHYDIRLGECATALDIAQSLLRDEHDLIHKAVGWMLREVGKHCGHAALIGFLDAHAPVLPRTTLRYAIEHFSPRERKHYLEMRAV